ncbi:MAG: thioredoxin family protein [Thermodesulfobacteriota bacterium]
MASRMIVVAGRKVGLSGLDEALAGLEPEWAARPEAQAGAELVARLERENYIPASARADYAAALAREYRRHLGLPVAAEPAAGLEVKVLGQGCARCEDLAAQVMNLMAGLGLVGSVEHVRDMLEIAAHGVMGSPALVINGRVKAVGAAPSEASLRQWLLEAAGGQGGGSCC